jgi:hypothetical protein
VLFVCIISVSGNDGGLRLRPYLHHPTKSSEELVLQCIAKEEYKSIDPSEKLKTVSELQNEFNKTYIEIQKYKEDPSCEQYHKLLDHLEDLDQQILHHPAR